MLSLKIINWFRLKLVTQSTLNILEHLRFTQPRYKQKFIIFSCKFVNLRSTAATEQKFIIIIIIIIIIYSVLRQVHRLLPN